MTHPARAKYFLISLVAALMLLPGAVRAQIVDVGGVHTFDIDSARKAFDKEPYFGLYKDNYFIFGPPVFEKMSKNNTNVKFQISIAQRLTGTTLPGGTYLYLFYTQKCFWNVLDTSFPMSDINFNPGIGLTKPLFSDGRYIGKLSFVAEHESNGRDSTASRSWNRFSLSANILVVPSLMVYAKYWIPWVDGQNNRDILDYVGIYSTGLSYRPNSRFSASVMVTKRRGRNFNFNTVVELSFKIFPRDNQYLFVQYYNGYGEGLLDYNVFKSQIRVGFVIKPKFFSDF